MSRNRIRYFTEDIEFIFPDPKVATDWVQTVVRQEGYRLISLSFIFCSDNYLHAKNVAYLQHDTLTDVITFSYAEKAKTIEGEVYISIERVKDNAITYGSNFWDELYTVMIHGVLHLLGYKDGTPSEAQEMRQKEKNYLAIKS